MAFTRMMNTWKARSRANQEFVLELIKENLRDKIWKVKEVILEVTIPIEGLNEDNDALTADLTAFWKAQKTIKVAPRPAESLDHGEDDDSVIDTRLRGIDFSSNVEMIVEEDEG